MVATLKDLMRLFDLQIFPGIVPMSANAKMKANGGKNIKAAFDVQVFTKDGRLVNEYTLTPHDDDVCTLSAAETCACKNLADYHG